MLEVWWPGTPRYINLIVVKLHETSLTPSTIAVMSFTRETIKIPSVDAGVALDVWLYRPNKPAPFPVIVAGSG